MTRPSKRLRTTKSHLAQEPCFDDMEPLGDQLLTDAPQSDDDLQPVPIPPLTAGTDSTKPTPFDKLPWKTVKLPEFIGDGLTFEADGGLLGLEELDGEVWEEIKTKNRNPTHPLPLKTAEPSLPEAPEQADDRHLESNEKDTKAENSTVIGPHQSQSPSRNQNPDGPTLDKEVRKNAKKERLAALRELKRNSKSNQDRPANPDRKSKKKERHVTSKDDSDLEQVDWAAAAELDGFSDMDDDPDPDRPLPPFDDSQLPEWSHLKLSNALLRGLHYLSFTKPTPVQAASLPVSLSPSDSPRDLVVIAETGSGKTLAYALPIINAMMNSPPPSFLSADHGDSLPITTLIMTPTRELCLQVKSHIDSLLKAMCSVTASPPIDARLLPKNRTGISTVSICGGIAIVKQRKQLERSKKLMQPGRGGRGCIVIGTPGRLWDLIQSWDALAEGIRGKLDWLVIDEADKMIERGHFEEIEKILKLTKRSRHGQADGDEWQDEWGENEKMFVKEDIRTMVFSATMDKNLQINLKKNWRKHIGAVQAADPMQDLLERIDFRDEQPELIDLTPQGRMVGGLKECKIECVLKDKDLYLFHFLLRYSGRTIVFLSSIAALRRLSPLLTLLFPHTSVLSLHSEMQQRSRLKALDRFRSTAKSILLSTDVAARGLDIPLVDHVIHYQVPRTVDCYVHRSGRTARAGREGVALALVGPDEVKVWRSLMKSLGKADDMPSPPIEHSISNKLKDLLELAKTIDTVEHSSNKQAHEENWLKKTAEMMEIDLSSSEDGLDDTLIVSKRKSKASSVLARQLRSELAEKLSDPIILKGMVIKQTRIKPNRPVGGNCYITDPELMERLLKGDVHEKVVGLKKNVSAVEEIVNVQSQGKRKFKK